MSSATEALEAFAPQYDAAYFDGLRRKLGLFTARDGDLELVQELLQTMAAGQADFTLTFRRLCDAAEGTDSQLRALFANADAYDAWSARWRQRIEAEPVSAEQRGRAMRQANPLFIPRNHLVEAVIQAAVERQDFSPFEDLLEVVLHPYEERPGLERYTLPATPEERVLHTFCGT